eukprot:IDg23537t1
MLRLEVVKSSNDLVQANATVLNYGTEVTRRLISPWMNSNRVVCGDSAFSSVQTAQCLYSVGMRYIGVVKSATRGFPMQQLSGRPMNDRGTWYSMICESDNPEQCKMMAVLWVDRERRYFIATTDTTHAGSTIYRERWRRVGNVSMKITTETAIPKVAETYYSVCSQVDRHNRCRQDDLKLEKKFQVKEWSLRVNSSLLAICIVDAWLLYKGIRGSRDCMNPNDFYHTLAEQLIDNKFNLIGPSQQSTQTDDDDNELMISGLGPHLTPTTRKRKRSNGNLTNHVYQGRCCICRSGYKSKYVCSHCTREEQKDVFICHSSTGRNCFGRHVQSNHDKSD